MNITNYRSLLLCSTLAITACGGGDDTSSSSDVSLHSSSVSSELSSAPNISSASSLSSTLVSSSSTFASSSAPSLSDLERGKQLFDEGCASCHAATEQSVGEKAAGIGHDLASLTQSIAVSMPLPVGGQAPSDCVDECADLTAKYIASVNPFFNVVDSGELQPATGEIDPAPITMSRLNRAEYNNTVRDLFGTQLTPADNFPEDDFAKFNNDGDVLTTSLLHLENYNAAATALADEYVEYLRPAGFFTPTAGSILSSDGTFEQGQQDFNLYVSGIAIATSSWYPELGVNISAIDEVNWRVQLSHNTQMVEGATYTYCFTGTASDEHTIYTNIDGAGTPDYLSIIGGGKSFTLSPQTQQYSHTFEARSTDETARLIFSMGSATNNLIIDNIGLYLGEQCGPLLTPEQLPAKTLNPMFTVDCLPTDDGCAETIATELGQYAWRRPLNNEEVSKLVSAFDAIEQASGDAYWAAKVTVRAILLSPNFIYRPEASAGNASIIGSTQAAALNGYELASRLSYFLWSSLPDQELMSLAADGKILQEATLRNQVERMLDDPKAQALINNFAVQWIGFREIDNAQPYGPLFPNFDEALRSAFKTESRLFFENLISSNAPVTDLVAADYSFVNQRLADHYSVDGAQGEGFQKIRWPSDSPRRGYLGQGAILTARAHSKHTSPVLRGVWVMEKLLCDKPPEPTMNVIDQFPDIPAGLNPREESELHRDSSTVCYSCHAYMDPIGYGLENFDAVGQWRTQYPDGDMVDAASVLPSGDAFNGPLELSNVLASSPDMPLCAIQYTMTYALGRVVNTFEATHSANQEPSDYPAIYSIYQKTQANGHRLRDIMREIVLSPAFRQSRSTQQ